MTKELILEILKYGVDIAKENSFVIEVKGFHTVDFDDDYIQKEIEEFAEKCFEK